MSTEVHKWKWYIPQGATILLIGTFPTHERNWSFNFFYPNCANNFWRVMSAIADTELKYLSGNEAIAERKLILDKLKTGVTDMGLRVKRNDGASVDHKLELAECMDIKGILDEHKTINKIILTSSSGKVSAFAWFKEYLNKERIKFSFNKEPLPFYGHADIRGKINVAVVKSTSPLAAGKIDDLISMYRAEIV